jgi:hypothetical protein
MMGKKILEIKPTFNGVKSLLKDLDRWWYPETKEAGEEEAARKELQAIEEKYQSRPDYVRAKKKLDQAYEKNRKISQTIQDRVRDTRRKFLSEGLTPSVLAEIKSILKYVKSHSKPIGSDEGDDCDDRI